VRDQARMSALFLYRMLQKGYSCIMSAVLDAERQRAKDAAAAIAEQEEEVATVQENATRKDGGNVVVTTKPEAIPMPRTAVAAATPLSQPFVFCRDTLLSRGGFDRPIPVKCEAMSC
jgi:anion-transporting  ArsA/GET3 family ATPase